MILMLMKSSENEEKGHDENSPIWLEPVLFSQKKG